MQNKIVLGTANFTLPYGVLGKGAALAPNIVGEIFDTAVGYRINTIDTAFAYGDPLALIAERTYLPNLKIITKFSAKEDLSALYDSMSALKNKYALSSFHGLLLHDPQNLDALDPIKLSDFVQRLKDTSLVEKFGVSVYSVAEALRFGAIITPDLVQIPFNPLNQQFDCAEFKDYVFANNIEVHARSLFLQGILLANELPESLQSLQPIWQEFKRISNSFGSRLDALMAWGLEQTWINKWVLGVSSATDLQAILHSKIDQVPVNDLFAELSSMFHPMVDPRNWSKT